MIKKILIAEDHESANLSVQRTVEELGYPQPEHVHYCDDAFKKIQIGLQIGQPYDILITDLYFEEDSRVQKIPGGMALISAVREIQRDLKILVFSAENKASIIEKLFEELMIDGYVRKARNDAKELKSALEAIFKQERYLPRHLMQIIGQKNTHDFSDYDITIISLLAKGMRQNQIPAYLQEKQILPSSLSSLEKRLNHIKDALDFSKNEQLVAFCKDMGII